jgi:hypothetical protein
MGLIKYFRSITSKWKSSEFSNKPNSERRLMLISGQSLSKDQRDPDHELGPCRLLELPGELRNKIWELVIPHDDTVYCPSQFPPILHTCRVSRKEAGSIYFSENLFDMAPEMDKLGKRLKLMPNTPNLTKWLDVVGRSGFVKYIRYVSITRGINLDAIPGVKFPDNYHEDYLSAQLVLPGNRSFSETKPGKPCHMLMAEGLNRPSWTESEKALVCKAYVMRCLMYLLQRNEAARGSVECWKHLLKETKRFHGMRMGNRCSAQLNHDAAVGESTIDWEKVFVYIFEVEWEHNEGRENVNQSFGEG